MKALIVRDLSVTFSPVDSGPRVLDRVNLEIESGEMLGLVAPSGSGKSVLAKAIMNFTTPPGRIIGGEVIVLEQYDMFHLTRQKLRDLRGGTISLIGSTPRSYLNPLMTVGDQIAKVYLAHHSGTPRRVAIESAIQMMQAVGISDPIRRYKAYPHELSGGMAQRIIISMALINSPKVLIADEPTFGLDATIQRQVLDLIARLIREIGTGTLMLNHDFGVIAQYCQRVAALSDGRVVAPRPVREFFGLRSQDRTEISGHFSADTGDALSAH